MIPFAEDKSWRWKLTKRWKDDRRVDGLLFNHIHFYGTYDHYANSRRWMKKEVRVIRNDRRIRSLGDAMTFSKGGKKVDVKSVDATFEGKPRHGTPIGMMTEGSNLPSAQ